MQIHRRGGGRLEQHEKGPGEITLDDKKNKVFEKIKVSAYYSI